MKRQNGNTGITAALLLAICTLFAQGVSAQTKKNSTGALSRPKLVVGIVVDQMRWDYLYRFYDRYGKGGFKRLLREGFSCENTFINYLPSATAVGHTTIYSGAVPAISGITGNNWIDQLSGQNIYCVEDSTVQTVGSASDAGKMSPRNLLVTTVTDELRLATNFRSRVVGVSLKDRAAILPAGHTPTAAFWFDDAEGKFISSSYYMKQLPDWLNWFNERLEPQKLVAQEWHTLYPIQTYHQSTDDDVSWEGRLGKDTSTTFPHKVAAVYKQRHGVIRNTPFGNTLTLDLAKAAIAAYRLGQQAVTDFLTINCASTDYVGHMFGVNAIETEDTYLRLDKDLSGFFTYLDQTVGKNNYTVFLTADHGAAHAVDYLKQYNVPADFWNTAAVVSHLNAVLKTKFGTPALVRSGLNYQVHYNLDLIDQKQLDLSAIKRLTIDYLRKQPGVLFAVDMDAVSVASVPEVIKTKLLNSYNYKRSGSVAIIPEAGWLSAGKTGTSHGTWNPYDTHIPLLLMGAGIKHGATNRQVNMTDIAPTIAALLHIQMPNGCVGTPITEVTTGSSLQP